jgi:DNA polymerase-3 subunit alpha
MSEFVHLHLHTEYSMLDGLANIPLIVEKAAKEGMPAVAMTDHGNMYGAVALYNACAAHNKEAAKKGGNLVKAIIGTEFYVCDDLTQKTRKINPDDESDRRHLVLLAKDETGYKNLSLLNTIAFRDGYYYKPRIDLKTLAEHHEGLVCLSACIAGDVPQAILRHNYDKAEELIKWFKDLFGEDYYLEMQNHGLKEELEVNQYLRQYSKKYGVKLVVTNDVHYVEKSDALAHDVLLCVQTGKDYDDPNRMRFNGDGYYFKTYEEMCELFPDDREAIRNTLEVADKCNFNFVFGHYMFPNFKPDTGEEPLVYLRKLIDDGVKRKYGEETPEIRERIENELAVISKQGFVEYFLIVWDYIRAARDMGISVGPGRGSGAGSIVAYLIGITDIDPLKYDLYFERFLNSERVSAPDFDVDFEDCRRQEVIEYVKNKYGEERVCKIVTFGTMAAKNAIKDVGRALGIPYADCDKITKAMPSKQFKMGKEVELALPHVPHVLKKIFGFYEPNAKEKENGLTREHFAVDELVELYDTNPNIKRVADIAMRLENTPRQSSTHACGVIIGHDVLDKHMPLGRNGDDITSQYTGVELESLGFLKMDFLGLRNLSDIKECINFVKQNYGVEIDFNNCTYDDPKVFELISTGNTDAIFQIESAGFKKFLRELKPTCLEDIIAAVSLFRPGPMESIPKFVENKHNPDKVTFDHPLLKPILEQTYGCIVYQEQVMKIVQTLAGYTLGQADMVRRMMGKKKVEEMAKEEVVFLYGKGETVDDHGHVSGAIEGCLKRGVSEEVARQVWAQMKDFAKYAFNKSHAAAYSFVTYQTAYLKLYYEPEFLTAFLNNRITDIDKVRKYTTYAKSEGIPVLPPDINESMTLFSVKNKSIRYGLAAIKNVGLSVIDEIIKEREKNGKYTDFESFVNRLESATLNKKQLENLIYAGAFDCLGVQRSQLIAVYEKVLDKATRDKKQRLTGQLSLFGLLEQADSTFDKVRFPDIPEYPTAVKLAKEKEVSGIYLTGHPLDEYADYLKAFSCNSSMLTVKENDEDEEYGEETEAAQVKDGDEVEIGGMIVEASRKISKKTGKEFGIATLEDLYGTTELMLSGNKLTRYAHLFEKDKLVSVRGRVRLRADGASISVDSMSDWNGVKADKKPRKICVYYSFLASGKAIEDTLRNIFGAYPGKDEVYVKNTDDGKVYSLPVKTDINEVMIRELYGLVGSHNIKIVE